MEDPGRVVERGLQCRYWLSNFRRPEGLHRRAIKPRTYEPIQIVALRVEFCFGATRWGALNIAGLTDAA